MHPKTVLRVHRLAQDKYGYWMRRVYDLEAAGVNAPEQQRFLTLAYRKARQVIIFGDWLNRYLDMAEQNRAELSDPHSAAMNAFNAIAAVCGCPEWDYPGQLVRDVQALAAEVKRLRTQLGVDENGETLADRYRLAMEARDVELATIKAEVGPLLKRLSPDPGFFPCRHCMGWGDDRESCSVAYECQLKQDRESARAWAARLGKEE